MSDKDALNLGYFNVDMSKKNSILENAKYQDNEISMRLNKMELLSQDIKMDLLKKDKRNNVIKNIDFKNNKSSKSR